MVNDALETIQLRNVFYRDNFRRSVVALIISLALNVVLALAVSYLYTSRPEPRYFATSPDGRITTLQPLAQPVYSQSTIMTFATNAAVAAFSYDFVNYRSQLENLSTYFTADGWSSFTSSVKSSLNLETVITKKLVSTAVATGAPVLIKKGVLNGRYVWKVQLPVLVTYQSASTAIRSSYVITMMVSRVDVLRDPKGISITQFVASVGSANTTGAS